MKKCILLVLAAMLIMPNMAWAAKASSFTVAIDAGHGYNTSGKRSPRFSKTVSHSFKGQNVIVRKGEQFREHVANTGVAYNLEKILRNMGFKTVKVAWNDANGRDDTSDMSLSARQNKIRSARANISVSCHFNAYGSGSSFNTARGICTYSHSSSSKAGSSKTLAKKVQSRVAAVYKQSNRGTPTANFAMCNCGATGCRASILVEFAFMTNQGEAEKYFCNPEAWFNYAVAVARGICDYTGVTYTGPGYGQGFTTSTNTSNNTTNTSSSSSSSSSVKSKSGKVTVICSGLNMRTSPNGKVSKVAYRGQSFTVVGITSNGSWYKLSNGLYVSTNTSLVRFTATSTSSSSGGSSNTSGVRAKSGLVTIITSALNVRVAPNGKISCVVTRGQVFTVVGVTSDGKWYKLKSGLYLSSSSKYVKFRAR